MYIKYTAILLGTAIAALAAPFVIYPNLGADPFTAFNQGLGYTLGISFGMAVNIFNAFFLILIFILNRKMIHIATLCYLLLLGPLSDLFLGLLEPALTDLPLPLRIASLVLGITLIGFGLGVYQAAELGAGPSDSFNQTLSQKLNIPLRYERMGFDAVLVIGAFFLGGNIHIGTILGILLIGPIMAPTFHKGSNYIRRMIN